jgi:hypothetical protein
VRRLVVLAPLLAACNSTPTGTLKLVTGGETDTFTRSPAPTSVRVSAVDLSGKVTTLATASLPTDTIDLGNLDENGVSSLEVQGLDAKGNVLVYGDTIPIQYGTLESATLQVFVQRTREFARLPSNMSDSRPAPVLSPVQGQYLFVGGGSDSAVATTSALFDFELLAPLASPPTMPFAPTTVAFAGPYAILIDSVAKNQAEYFDFTANATLAITPPSGGSFADVAGGQVVYSDTGVEYIVGATRTTGPPTAAVLVINTADSSDASYITGHLWWATLSAPRLGASAAWIPGRGLIVTGGSATAQGAEIIAPLPTTGTPAPMTGAPLPYPADPSVGAGSTYLVAQPLLLVAGGLDANGKDAGVRTIDPACTASCAPKTWSGLPVPIGNAQAFSFVASAADGAPPPAIVIGNDAMGTTHAFTLTSTAATEVPTKVPHKNARATPGPLGSILVVGGATEIESFYP